MIAIAVTAAAPPVRAQVVYDSDARGSAAAAALTFDHTIGSADNRLLLVAVVVGDPAAGVASVSYGGVALSRAGGVDGANRVCRVELWRRAGPTSGRHAVDVRLNAPTQVFAVAVSYSGVDPGDPLAALATSAGTGTTAAVSLPTAADQMVVDWVCAGGGNVVVGSPATGQSRRDSWPGDPAGGVSDRDAETPDTTMTWRSVGSFDWGMGAAALRPASPPTDGGAPEAGAPTSDGAPAPDAGASGEDGASSDRAAAGGSDDAAGGSDDAGAAATDAPLTDAAPLAPADAGTAVVKLAVGCACDVSAAPGSGPLALAWLACAIAVAGRRRRCR